MTIGELQKLAVANLAERCDAFGSARHTFSDGGILFCSVRDVAGVSVTSRHRRVTFHFREAGEEYSKQISRLRAVEMLAS